MSKPLKLQIPQKITEFDENMLVPLSKNFGEIQIKVAQTQQRVDQLENDVATIIAALSTAST